MIKQILSLVLIVFIGIQISVVTSMVQPILSLATRPNPLQVSAIKAGIGNPGIKVLNAVVLASTQTGLSKEFLLSLMSTESSFHISAVSSKDYQGLMQIPKQWAPVSKHEDINTLVGARIFMEKLVIAKGDYRKAIILYKGWGLNHPEGKRQADKVLSLARRLKEV